MAAITTLITIASIAYQVYQADKMKKAAKDAAEARKGFELVVEGDVYPIPVVYGRAKVGGIRAYSNTSSNFYHPNASNYDQQFLKARSDYTQSEPRWDGDETGSYDVDVTYPSANLIRNIAGSKNEFLFIEQALCQGPINRVIDVVFDESRYLDDPDFVSFPDRSPERSINQAGLRIDVHYGGYQNKADALITANFIEREKAYFTNLAHATIAIRQFRDQAQFNQIPVVQFFIEGKKVRTISNGVLSSERVYSNNPAYCLLDYLLEDANYSPGKSVNIEDIDLVSFEYAAQICDTIVAENKPVGGKIWSNTENTFSIKYRNIPLYECNIILDSSKKIRENIEAILSTMGDARLVWSQGKYKLLLQYPSTNEDVEIAAVITDDDIVQNSTIEQNWPDSSQRLNHCIVRFKNEAENFKEDSVSWPPKVSGSAYRGFNGKYYPAGSADHTFRGKQGDVLNKYSVWDELNSDGDGNSDTVTEMSWKFIPLFTGNYTLKWAIDNYCTFQIVDNSGVTIYSQDSGDDVNLIEPAPFLLQQNQIYIFRFVNLVNTAGPRAAAFMLTDDTGVLALTSRSVSYEDYIPTVQSNEIYNTFITEDNNVELEDDIFLEGCSDYYHALAKAEELVRTSRTALGLKFKYNLRENFLEPGDIIRVDSQILSLSGSSSILLRVNEVKVEEGLVCEVTGTRFDYTQLAWNVTDDQYLVPINIYNNLTIASPAELIYEANSTSAIYGSAGLLRWTPVEDNLIAGYILYIHIRGHQDEDGRFLFDEIGRVGRDESIFNLPSISVTNAIFGIRAFTSTNTLSRMTTTGVNGSVETVLNPLTRSVEITTNNVAFVFQANDAGWNVPSITLNTAITGYSNPFYQWYIDDVFLQGETGSSIVVLPFDDFRTRRYKVEVGETGNFSATQTEDVITLFSLQEGSDAYNIALSNESVQIETELDGSIPLGTFPLTINTIIARGSEVITTGYNIVYSLEEAEGVVATIDSVTGVVTVTSITGLANTITVVAEVTTGVFLRKLLYVSKLIAGVSPPLLSLKTTAPGFLFESNTATTASLPDSITLTAVFENTTGQATFVAEAFNAINVSLGNLTLPAATHTASNSTVVISDELFGSIANTAYVRVIASLNTLSDTITLYRLNDGENALNLYMHNENHSVPATSDGTVTDLDEAFTYIFVFQGINNVTNDWTFTKSDIGMNTILTQDSSDPPRMLLQVQSVTNTIATTTVTATRTGYPTLEKVFTITKSLAGEDGTDGAPGAPGTPGASVPGPRSANGYIYYKYSVSGNPGQPNPASGYNFSTGNFSSLNSNWSLNFEAPSSSDGQYWAVRFSVVETTYNGSQTVTLDGPFKWQNLNGLITFSNIQTGFNAGVTVIDGGKITADTLLIDRIRSGTRNFTNGKFALGEGAQVANTFNTTIGAEVNPEIGNVNRIPIISYNACPFDYGHGLAAACRNENSFGLLALNLGNDITLGGGRSSAFLAGEYRGGIFRRLHDNRDTVTASSVTDRGTNVRTETIISDNDYTFLGTYSPSFGSGVAWSTVYLNYSSTAAFFYSYPGTSQFNAASTTYGAYAFHAAGTTPSVFLAYNNTSAGRQSAVEAYTNETNARLATRDGGISYSGYFNNNVKIAANVFPFTGSHEGEIIETPEIGDIVVDVEIVERKDISNVYLLERLSTKPKEKGVVGVVSFIKQKEEMYTNPNDFVDVDLTDDNILDTQPVKFGEPELSISKTENTATNIQSEEYIRLTDDRLFIYFNAVGEGQVNVCGENGNIEIGDLIVTSSIPGKGMKQDDDIVRSYTVAKSRENVTFDSPDQVKMIACIYLCG